MQDGKTRAIVRSDSPRDDPGFFENFRAAIVTLSGSTAGNEYPLEQPQVVVGRGPDVDLTFADPAMSREHAAFELVDDGFRIRDLASTNGVRVNGSPCLVRDLCHGDRIEIGEHRFQFVVEACKRAPRTYVLPDQE